MEMGFLWILFSIATAVVILRYHHVADAILGIALSFAIFASPMI